MIYFTADPHFGHEATRSAFNRPFSSVAEMDAELIRRWNQRVREEDTVYLLGDISGHRQGLATAALGRLRGRKVLLLGNHDRDWKRAAAAERANYFQAVEDILELRLEGRELILCHYPLLEWPGQHHGSWQICGHIHNRREGRGYAFLRSEPRVLNAGVDVNDYQPVTFAEMWANNCRFYLPKAPLDGEGEY